MYGSSPIAGKRVRPSISSGMRSFQAERSSSVACADRDRLATQKKGLSPAWRTEQSTERFSGRMNVMVPRPKASVDLRTEISRLVADSSDDRLRDCASTL